MVAGLTIVEVNDDATLYDLPVTNSMYVLTSSTNDYRLFRVIANKENKGHQYEITAVQHNPAKFDQIDQEQTLVLPGQTAYGSWPVSAVQNLSASVNTYVDHGSNKSDITISWSPPPSPNPADAPGTFDARVISYDILWSNGGTNWAKLTSTSSTNYTAVDVSAGSYLFMVRAATPLTVGPYAEVAAAQATGVLAAPATPPNLTANVDYNVATLYWDQVTDTGTAGYFIFTGTINILTAYPRPVRT